MLLLVFSRINHREYDRTLILSANSPHHGLLWSYQTISIRQQPRYGWVEEQHRIVEASKKIRIIPAKFKEEKKEIVVKEAVYEMKVIPATFRTAYKEVKRVQAYKAWVPLTREIYGIAERDREGHIIQQIDPQTGDVICLMSVDPPPDKVAKQVMKAKPTVERTLVEPEERMTITKRVMIEPPTSVLVDVPAQYQTVRVYKRLEEEKVDVTNVPGRQQNFPLKVKREDTGTFQWGKVYCETSFPGKK